MNSSSYHHGSLRSALLNDAAEAISESGASGLSLRDLARRAGVSYAAPTYHFGDKAGLLTALATQGFESLADELESTERRTGDFIEVGVAYVRFALKHPAYFDVMYRRDLLHTGDSALMTAQARAEQALYTGTRQLSHHQLGDDIHLACVAAWSIVHGFAALHLNRALPARFSSDPEAAARAIAGLLVRKG
ncbi:TetR/AcrR family transcriptional regulator [Cryobacterium sp. SO1]|uniref:TetR/AcrR family transcriptional regulator n=1 Tax=Cryobacterium sp. SO1 TaxID=1897061 RepID=UPI001022D23C|nr:TetR/AcrR family transcriptional regulator [Cryobacterium sp. SO1]RZI36390.1 HTH-type transcriptional regulator BetI [Cryobacterium sp. SO1]